MRWRYESNTINGNFPPNIISSRSHLGLLFFGSVQKRRIKINVAKCIFEEAHDKGKNRFAKKK
jgi:hypothetical protein